MSSAERLTNTSTLTSLSKVYILLRSHEVWARTLSATLLVSQLLLLCPYSVEMVLLCILHSNQRATGKISLQVAAELSGTIILISVVFLYQTLKII